MSKNEMIEKEYENLRSYCFSAYKKTNLNYRIEFDDFFNDFIVYILSYDLIQLDNFWQCIKRQLKSFIYKQYTSINSFKRKDYHKENKIYIDDYNNNHAEDSFYAYEDKYSIESELIDLPKEERKIFSMKVEGYTISDIAKEINKSYNYTKNIYYKVKEELKKEYTCI